MYVLLTCGFLSVVVAKDITQRRRLARALQVATREAQRASAVKSEFLATINHELRTPLTSIRGSLGLIAGGAAGPLPDRAASLVRIALANSERLTRLINDILDAERIESGRVPLDMGRHRLRAMVDQVMLGSANYMPDRKARLALEDDAPGAEVEVDPHRLQQIVANFVSNAIKFSPPEGTVTVRIMRPGPGEVRVAVTDRGPGVPESFRPRIFGRFEQADGSNARTMSGTGLGLSITKGLAELLGGRVGFETAEGAGSTFFVTLPELPPLAAEPSDEAAPAQAAVPRGRVLICEDDPDAANAIAAVLAAQGHASDLAPDIATARHLLETRDYEAMTLDLRMGQDNALELADRAKGSLRNANLPVVVISGFIDEDGAQEQGRTVGVVDWLRKPVEDTQVVAALHRAIRARPGGNPRILHVEDDDGVLQVISESLPSAAAVTSARSLAEARAALRAQRFDVVILDVGLPDGSGLDLLPHIAAETAVIIFSGVEFATPPRRVDAAMTKSRTPVIDLADAVRRILDSGERGRPPAAKTA